jgi:nucleoside-diphosphate-sugar epimerase
MNILIIGGTRNIGFLLAERLVSDGHRITLLNRGITRDELPPDLPRLRCDRTDAGQLRRALARRTFDAVVDTVLYKGQEADAIVELLSGQVGHYVALSTGQVYLVREGAARPFRESDYAGPTSPAPEPMSYDYEEWLYGMDKRAAEDSLAAAWRERQFPYTTLRLPMVNGERDRFHRLYNYVLRLKDGGPILIPDGPGLPLRHVDARDVVEAITRVIFNGLGKGQAFNISQDETLSLPEFLGIVAEVIGVTPRLVAVNGELLREDGFMPDCSPFSERWMSELDNALSKAVLGMTYTPARTSLERIVGHYLKFPPPVPPSYRRRGSEKGLAQPA